MVSDQVPLAGTFDVVPFQWKTYGVSRAAKAPLLDFVVRGLEMRGCAIVSMPEASQAPFYVVFDSPSGERQGVLVYAFFANSRVTAGRPNDERRFQIKYGGDLKDSILEVAVDLHGLITTIFIGIDVEERVFVAADPLMNNPSPMSRSIEFKNSHLDAIKKEGWVAWERDRRPGKSKHRPTAEIEDLRTEILIGATQDKILDLVQFERISAGLDPGERHLLADKIRTTDDALSSHSLVKELGIPPSELFDLIQATARLKMAVRGWVAEQHLLDALLALPDVSDCRRLTADGQPDIILRWQDGPPILVECKNTLRSTYADGSPKVDFQRTRASKGDPCSRYYAPGDFPVLAACLHAVTERWEFAFALTRELAAHETCSGKIASNLRVSEPTFTRNAALVFGAHYSQEGAV